MVKRFSLLKKNAFTMIELIFAIVIIAITVISLPMMTQASGKSIEGSVLQEAIFASEAILNESTTYYWDTRSQEDTNTSGGYSRVINMGSCLGAGPPYRRVGHINRQCLDNNTTGPLLTTGGGTTLEVAPTIYNNTIALEGANTTGGAATYKSAYNVIATVSYCGTQPCTQFGLEANNPNLKQIQVQIINPDTNTTLILLRGYSANIGEVKPESRIF